MLREEFMVPYGISTRELAQALDVEADCIAAIVAPGKPGAVTQDIALRLAGYFGTTQELWLNLQQAHDLSSVRAWRQPKT
jgi:addiction module HigA family antidote